MKTVFAFFFMLLANTLLAQDQILIDGKPCPINGSAKPGSRTYYLNLHKNRYHFPAKEDYDTTITLQRLVQSADPNDFSEEKAAVVTGYVYDIKVGGVESCNCKSKNPEYRDTHIELIADKNNSSAAQRVITEVTPRLRAIMAGKEDWSTQALRKKYKGRKVQIAGWLTYDSEHELEAYANDPQNAVGRNNWRATNWEIHPVTSIKIIDDEVTTDPTLPQPKTSPYQNEKTPKNNKSQLWIGLVAVVLLLVLIYFLLRKIL